MSLRDLVLFDDRDFERELRRGLTGRGDEVAYRRPPTCEVFAGARRTLRIRHPLELAYAHGVELRARIDPYTAAELAQRLSDWRSSARRALRVEVISPAGAPAVRWSLSLGEATSRDVVTDLSRADEGDDLVFERARIDEDSDILALDGRYRDDGPFGGGADLTVTATLTL